MDREEALKLLRGGKKGVTEWNRRRAAGEGVPNLNRAELGYLRFWVGVDEFRDLTVTKLSSADLSNTILYRANLSGADLSGANLFHADLTLADLSDADLSGANLYDANLSGATLFDANLSGAILSDAILSRANLSDVILSNATLFGVNLSGVKLSRTDLKGIRVGSNLIADTDLSAARGLSHVVHEGPSSVSTSTLVRSKGKIPERFLRGCGLQSWEVLAAKLYDPTLTPAQINELQYQIFDLRASSPIFLGGVFISYSHEDSPFVDKVHTSLMDKGANVWLDRHDLVAGPMQEQVDRALRLHDVVLLVLSEASIESDWVEHELEMARKKEKEEHRDVLCPVALDESWKAKMNDVLWRQVKKKNVLDFSEWETGAFDDQFAKLLKGLKIYYAPKAQAGDQDAGGAT